MRVACVEGEKGLKKEGSTEVFRCIIHTQINFLYAVCTAQRHMYVSGHYLEDYVTDK